MNLSEIEIGLCLDTLEINDFNNITGGIYFSYNDQCFPEKCWDDFVVVILGWWHKALLNLIRSPRNGVVEEFLFMDGPFLVKVKKLYDDVIKLVFIEERLKSKHIYFTCQTSIHHLKNALTKNAKLLLEEIEKRKWKTDDIDELKRVYNILKNINSTFSQ